MTKILFLPDFDSFYYYFKDTQINAGPGKDVLKRKKAEEILTNAEET